MGFRSVLARFLVVVLLVAGVTSCSRDDRPLEERLQATLDDRLVDSGVNGAAAAIIFPDGTANLSLSSGL